MQFVNLFENIKIHLGEYLTKTNEIIIAQAGSEVELIPQISKYLYESGGKRQRPLITLMFGKAFSAPVEETAKLAAAVEMIHTATLLHDDVIDQSSMRRGKATANKVWGNKEAILVGDFLLAQSFCLMVESDSLAALKLLAEASRTITEAEVWQLELLYDPKLALESYYKLISGKTAVLFAAAAAVVGELMNLPAEHIQACYDYGHNLGMAFQIIDDIIDYNASEAQAKKTVQNDLIEGKITLPLILCLDKMTAAEIEEVQSCLTLLSRGEGTPQVIYDLVRSYQGDQLASQEASRRSQAAITAISKFDNKFDTTLFKELVATNNFRLN